MEKTTMEIPLLSESRDAVLTLTLNRPKLLNALSHSLLQDLLEALKKAEKDPGTRCVVLAGSGRAFSAGADLADLKKMYESGEEVSLGRELRVYFNPVIRQIRAMEKPVVAAVHGSAAGAGASLALACDVKVCADTARFISAFVQVGLAPDSGMSYALARAMGLGLAMEYACTAKPLPAPTALEFGLINQVVPEAELAGAARAMALQLAGAPPKAVTLTKRTLNRALSFDFDAQLEYEAYIQEILGKTRDHREGVAAFLERRKPAFKGE